MPVAGQLVPGQICRVPIELRSGRNIFQCLRILQRDTGRQSIKQDGLKYAWAECKHAFRHIGNGLKYLEAAI